MHCFALHSTIFTGKCENCFYFFEWNIICCSECSTKNGYFACQSWLICHFEMKTTQYVLNFAHSIGFYCSVSRRKEKKSPAKNTSTSHTLSALVCVFADCSHGIEFQHKRQNIRQAMKNVNEQRIDNKTKYKNSEQQENKTRRKNCFNFENLFIRKRERRRSVL